MYIHHIPFVLFIPLKRKFACAFVETSMYVVQCHLCICNGIIVRVSKKKEESQGSIRNDSNEEEVQKTREKKNASASMHEQTRFELMKTPPNSRSRRLKRMLGKDCTITYRQPMNISQTFNSQNNDEYSAKMHSDSSENRFE